MMRILRRLEMVSRVGPITWNGQSRSDDQKHRGTRGNLGARSGTYPGHYAPPSAPMVGPVGQTVY